MLTIFHNPSCKKSREGLQYLKDSGRSYTVVEYLKHPVTEQVIERLLVKLNCKVHELIRTQEEYYKKHIRGKHFEEHELIRILVENPRLIRRPIVEGKFRAVVADPASNIDLIRE
ncbi:MAG: hypothetical protein PHP04_12345 [Bacteroidales bacterium]|nr:hypothetical protein [Bacteroidales bacterium]HNW72449.1 ArsC/Spx/MgsR family protein [Bacteroidales bacterium]HPS50239.1 ArsC/Spx/MgsR family protein [Bacteroidales bacterium]